MTAARSLGPCDSISAPKGTLIVWNALLSEVSCSKTPVHDIPKCVEVTGASIAIIDVVRVFPDINAQQWCQPSCCSQRILIRAGCDVQLAWFIRLIVQSFEQDSNKRETE